MERLGMTSGLTGSEDSEATKRSGSDGSPRFIEPSKKRATSS